MEPCTHDHRILDTNIYIYIYEFSFQSVESESLLCRDQAFKRVCLLVLGVVGWDQTNKQKKKTAQFLMLFLLRLLYGYALGTENCSLTDTFLVLLNVLKPFVF